MHGHRTLAFVPARLRTLAACAPWMAWVSITLTSAGCGTGEPPGEGYEIIGFVVESVGTGDDGPPVGGAMVRFQSDTGRAVDGVTESNGRYRLFIVSDSRFGQITANAAGFHEGRETVFFDTSSRRVDLVLPRDGSMPEP